MLCKNCIALGRDFIGTLCLAGNVIKYYDGGSGCMKSKASIKKNRDERLKKDDERYFLYRKEWGNER